MGTTRRTFLKAGLAAAGAWMARHGHAIAIPGSAPMLALHKSFKAPVKIQAVEQLLLDKTIYVRVRSADGAVGVCPGNARLAVTVPMAKRLVLPFFVGKDARDIEALVDEVYTDDSRGSVYKYAGMPFWNIVGHVEVALFDLLGRLDGVPVHVLLGGSRRKAIPVYISQFGRKTTAEQEVARAADDLRKAGAKATKLKIGLRMANSRAQMARDRRMIERARKTFGDDVAIYVDANGSYTVAEALEMGRHCEKFGVGFLEEPCPWQDYEATRRVAAGLKMTVAGGEQDSSLWQWRAMIDRRIVDLLQPDVFYNGGLVRSLRVAKMAEKAGMKFTPHSPTTLPRAAANLHLCSVVPNLGEHQEYRVSDEVTDGKVAVPTAPGLGLGEDEDRWKRAKVL
jgi:L-alanine-DL-glutamate epimerase-like enolase superfamily enzyme